MLDVDAWREKTGIFLVKAQRSKKLGAESKYSWYILSFIQRPALCIDTLVEFLLWFLKCNLGASGVVANQWFYIYILET